MDKNMIHIDDLVRQRLSGGEEQGRPEAWLHMREMLDQKMPVTTPAAGYNWRRMLGLMTGLVLLSAITVGSYQILTSTRFNSVGDKPVASANKHTEPYRLNNKNDDDYGNLNDELEIATNHSNKGVIASKTATEGNVSNKTQEVINKNIKKLNTAAKNSFVASTSRSYPIDPSNKAGRNSNGEISKNNAENKILKAEEKHELIPSTNNINAASNINTENKKATAIAPSGKNIADKKTTASQPVLSNNFNSAIADNTSIVKQPVLKEDNLPKDSMQKMTVVQRYIINPLTRTSRTIIDTISIESMAVEKNELLALTKNNYVEKSEEKTESINPAASLASKADAALNENLVPLANFKVHSQKTSKWNARSFDDVMRDVKFNLSQVRFYPGVSIGGNSNFGANNLSGVQFGLFGLVTFGENWNAMGELKYIHRFNNGSVLEDDYTAFKTNGSGVPLQSKVEHFFKFSTLQSIEMPIAIRYAAGRVNLFGGLNMAYNFRVDAEEITLQPNDSTYQPSLNPNWNDSKPTVEYDDFKARFSLGYLLGVGWEFSPSLQFDMRMTQHVWDNASGLGGQKVSQQYFKAPSMQLSIYYRFSQRNQIPKAK